MRCTSLLIVIALLTIPAAAQSIAELPASKDNTLYEDNAGALSNGAGESLFAGLTAKSEKRRGLVAFDLTSAFQGGIVVDSVQVQFNMTKSLGSTHAVSLHRVSRAWGEGTSNAPGEEGAGTGASAGDATWTQSVRPSASWSTPGGDFVATASAIQSISNTGTVTWYSTPDLVADVQAWLDDPTQNHGWLLKGNEQSSGSAMRFASRQHATTAMRPVLRIFYRSVATYAERESLPKNLALTAAWPNPFTSRAVLSITSSMTQSATVDVVDVHGRTIFRTERWLQAGSNDLSLDGSDWAPGVYWIRVRTDGTTMTRSIVRMR